MATKTSLKESLADLEKRKRQLIEELETKLLSIPENPRINRISDISFTTLASNLRIVDSLTGKTTSNWCPEYHDFRAQCQLIVDHLRGKPAEKLGQLFSSMIKNSMFVMTTSPYRTVRLHSDVVGYLRSIYRGEPC